MSLTPALRPDELQLVVGSMNRGTTYYTDVDGVGLSVFAFDPEQLSFRELATTPGIDNPTFLSVTPDGQYIYATAEVDPWNEGEVVVHRFDRETGHLAYIGKRATRGGVTSYNSLSSDGDRLFVTNFTAFDSEPGYSVAVFGIQPDGMLSEPLTAVRHDGAGPDPQRQTRSHAHSIIGVPGTDIVLVADLGLDQVLTYRISPGGALMRVAEVVPVVGGGPRHLALDPTGSIVFVITEMGSTVSSLQLDRVTGALTLIDTVSTLPADWAGGRNAAADIVVDPRGGLLYASNRGANSIATIAISGEGGRLAVVGHTSSEGKTPRNLALTPDGGHLLCANQESHEIVVFEIGPDGLPWDTSARLRLGTPMCMKIVP